MSRKTLLIFLQAIITIIIGLSSFNIGGQNSNDRAKAYYLTALKNYNEGNNNKSLERLDSTEEILDGTNAKILSLRIKNYVAQKDYENANYYLGLFLKNDGRADEKMKNEILTYLVEIEDGIKEIKKKKDKERQAIIDEQRRKRLDEAEKLKENREAALRRIENEIQLEVTKRIEAFKVVSDKKYRYTFLSNYKYDEKEQFWDNPDAIVVPYSFYDTELYATNWELIDREGTAVVGLKNKYDQIEYFFEGLAQVIKGDEIGYINEEGDEVIALNSKFVKLSRFSEGLAIAQTKDSLKGYINTTGEIVIEPQYKDTKLFNEGIAPVLISSDENELWGFIDKKGELIIQPLYKEAFNFVNGMAQVSTNRKYGFINKSGEEVIKDLYKLVPGYFNDDGEIFIGKPKSLASKIHPYMLLFNLNKIKEYWINKDGEKVKK